MIKKQVVNQTKTNKDKNTTEISINAPIEEKLRVLANLIVDRILEDQQNGLVPTTNSLETSELYEQHK